MCVCVYVCMCVCRETVYIGLAKMFDWVFPYDVMGKLQQTFCLPSIPLIHSHTHITIVMYAAFKIQILHKGLSSLTLLHICGRGEWGSSLCFILSLWRSYSDISQAPKRSSRLKDSALS